MRNKINEDRFTRERQIPIWYKKKVFTNFVFLLTNW